MNTATQDIQKAWNIAAKSYAGTLEKANLQLGLSLARMMNITSAKSILEVGSGSGLLSFSLLPTISEGAKFISSDLSDEMIRLAQEKKNSLKDQFTHVDHKFVQGDAQDLFFVPDESVDAYLSSLCAHLVPDANQMLQEAMRVTKKGGKIALSVLGNKENCSFMQIFNDRMKEFDIVTPPSRSIYYLGTKEKLAQIAKENGIHPDFCWVENVVMGVCEESDLQMILDLPANRRVLGNLEEEKRNKFIQAMKGDFKNKKENLEPLITENVLFVGTKL